MPKVSTILQEERLYTNIGWWKVSGQSDLLHNNALTDYKVTSVYAIKDGVKPEWEALLNLYNLLMTDIGFSDIEKLQIVAILRDHSKTKAEVDKNYPPPVVVIPVKMWKIDDTRRFAEERVKLHRDAQKLKPENLPPCTAEERWAKPECWAHMKEGRKTALKLYWKESDVPNPDTLPKGQSIQHSPGKCTRCESFCVVKNYCHQRNNARTWTWCELNLFPRG